MSNQLIPFRSTVPTRLDELFDGLFQEFWSNPAFVFERNWRPTDIVADEKEYKVEIELPRVKREQISVEAVDGKVVVSVKTDKVHFTRTFGYSDADSENSEVKLEDGVLTIKIPRQSPKAKKLVVK